MIALALVIGSATDHVTREMIFILAFLLGAARSFEMPTTQALLPSIVPAGLFPVPWPPRNRPNSRPPSSPRRSAACSTPSAASGSMGRP